MLDGYNILKKDKDSNFDKIPRSPNHKTLTTRMRLPIAFDGKLRWNLARTAPLLPCGRHTLPQMTLMWFGFLSLRPATAVLL
jgi:hypothetical protein